MVIFKVIAFKVISQKSNIHQIFSFTVNLTLENTIENFNEAYPRDDMSFLQ